jgi:hypothetical protein
MVVSVNIVFRVCIANWRRVPVPIQSRTYLFLLRTDFSSCGFAFMFFQLVE